MNQKYEISEIAHPQYPWLHRIRALSDVRPGVPKGHLGGYVQCEENLSQKGACWIADDAVVCDNARVYGSAWIGNKSHISGQAVISGDAHVGGNAAVLENAHVTSGLVVEQAVIRGDAEIKKDQRTRKSPRISGSALIYGSVPFPVSWTVKMKKKQKETQDILSYHTQAAGCSDKARAKASGGRQPIEECGRTGL